MKSFILLCSLCLSLLSLNVLAANDVWLDVRSAEEFNEGHLDGAINIPHTAIAQQIAGVVDDKTIHIHVYCKSGRRAGIAEQALRELGYKQVTNEGGYEQLVNKPNTPDERQ